MTALLLQPAIHHGTIVADLPSVQDIKIRALANVRICPSNTGRSMIPLATQYGAARASSSCASAPAGCGRAADPPTLVHARGEVSHG